MTSWGSITSVWWWRHYNYQNQTHKQFVLPFWLFITPKLRVIMTNHGVTICRRSKSVGWPKSLSDSFRSQRISTHSFCSLRATHCAESIAKRSQQTPPMYQRHQRWASAGIRTISSSASIFHSAPLSAACVFFSFPSILTYSSPFTLICPFFLSALLLLSSFFLIDFSVGDRIPGRDEAFVDAPYSIRDRALQARNQTAVRGTETVRPRHHYVLTLFFYLYLFFFLPPLFSLFL